MPRRARVTPGGLVYHVLNRTVAGLPLFRKEADFEAFERIMIEAQERHPTRIVAWCLMRNHWHFLLWPREEGEVTAFVRWLAHTHAMRWHVAHGTVGRGHLYQGRFKSFPDPGGRALPDGVPLCGAERADGRGCGPRGGHGVGAVCGRGVTATIR